MDVDDDLGELCTRMREADRTSCAIVHCEDDTLPMPTPRRPTRQRLRAATQ